MELKQL